MKMRGSTTGSGSFLFSKPSRPALEPNQPLSQRVQCSVFPA